jgi:hypothetical protein
MKLYEFAEIITGYGFRSAIEPEVDGPVSVFQAKDLVRDEPFTDINKLTKISQSFLGYEGYLKKNDILIVSRGMKAGAFRATTFASDATNVMASASVHVMRVRSSKLSTILPEYVSHYLNSNEGQTELAEMVTGSYIGALPRRELEKIDIPIVPIQEQQMLIDLYRNIRQQQKFLDRKRELVQKIVDAAFSTLTK